MSQPSPERLRDCARRLAGHFLKSGRMERAIPYIHCLQALPDDDWQAGVAHLFRFLLQGCSADQLGKVIYLLDEHGVFDLDNPRFFELHQSLLRHVENALNRYGTARQRKLARQDWVSRLKQPEPLGLLE